MRKFCCALVVMLGLVASTVLADEVKTPANANAVDILTGELWQKSTPEEKRSFLFGVDTAVTVEYFVNTKRKEKAEAKGKKFVSNLSPFEKGWMKALKDMPRKDLITAIDAWYEANPGQLERPVMAVIWFEIIAKRLPAETETK